MHLFGTFGTLMFIIGFAAATYLGIQKIIYTVRGEILARVTESPYFYLALTAMIIGTQLFLTGFIGELVSRSSADRNAYLIDDKINL